jgi:hypothetical protein
MQSQHIIKSTSTFFPKAKDVMLTVGKCAHQTPLYTVPKVSENFVTNNKGDGRLFSVAKVFFIDSWRPAATVITQSRSLQIFWDKENYKEVR